jgi:hypothetical protein
VLRPESFAGLFGAAPSIALATLTMATFKEGSAYVSIEGRSMILGAIASLFTASWFASCLCASVFRRSRQPDARPVIDR